MSRLLHRRWLSPSSRPRRTLLALEPLEDRLLLDGNGLLVAHRADFISGVDKYFAAAESRLSVTFFQQKIPVIGDTLDQITGAAFVEQVRHKVDAKLNAEFNAGVTN